MDAAAQERNGESSCQVRKRVEMLDEKKELVLFPALPTRSLNFSFPKTPFLSHSSSRTRFSFCFRTFMKYGLLALPGVVLSAAYGRTLQTNQWETVKRKQREGEF
jgi:hypothetical protein